MEKSHKITVLIQKKKAKSCQAWATQREHDGKDVSSALATDRQQGSGHRVEGAAEGLEATSEKLKAAKEELEESRATCSSGKASLTLGERKGTEDEQGLKSAQSPAREAEALLPEKQPRHAAEAVLPAEEGRRDETEADTAATEMELLNLQKQVDELEKVKAGILKEMGMVMKKPPSWARFDFLTYPLSGQIVLQRRKISSLKRHIEVAREWAAKERAAKERMLEEMTPEERAAEEERMAEERAAEERAAEEKMAKRKRQSRVRHGNSADSLYGTAGHCFCTSCSSST